MNFTAELLQNGYVIIQDISVFMKPGYAGIAYSDGDATEKRIADVITEAQDISIFSRELAAQCTDWPSLYHLAGTRANILRPFHSTLKQSTVLEIGAGCGAITRYLGECGAQVLALEGSPRRAAIARSRTRDLENVTVVADKFDQFRYDTRFDVITLIGVLEYAPLFTDGEDPVVSMLSRVREMLKPDGQLILAIENQLGLKYFAGFSEDHKGEPMFGIENRYERNGPQTFGRKVLIQKLKLAGFTNQQFMVPFPDYKLPISIVTEQGLNCDTFDSVAFAWQTARRDPQLPQHLVFAPELAWPVVAANGLTLDLANSFLVVAHASNEVASPPPILAYHYSTNGRHAAFCKETLFVQCPDKSIILKYSSLSTNLTHNTESKLVQFNFPQEGKYIQGETLSLQLLRIVSRDNWHIEEIGRILQQYVNIIQSFTIEMGLILTFDSIFTTLPGACFDIIPQNIICLDNGTYHIIDKEWILKNEMPLGWLLFRALLQLIYSVTRFGHPSTISIETWFDFSIAAIKSAGFTVTKEHLESFATMENQIQSYISGIKVVTGDNVSINLQHFLSCYSIHQALQHREHQFLTTQSHLVTKEAELTKIQSLLEHKKSEIKENLLQIDSLKNKIDNLFNAIELKDNSIFKMTQKIALQELKIQSLDKNIIKQKNNFSQLHTLLTQNLFIKIGFQLERLRPNNIRQYAFYIRKIRKNYLFNLDWYKNKYLDLQGLNIDPLYHYYYFGYKEGKNPNPYFDSSWYLEKNTEIAEKNINPLLHYILHGVDEGRNPSPYFDTLWYINEYPDIKQNNINPLAHFLAHGSNEGRNPNPYFDTKWYLKQYPDVQESGLDPLLHFITTGSKEGKNPSPYFNTTWYMQMNSDVKESGVEPLMHYILYGCNEGREPNPLFDSKWYIQKYQEGLKTSNKPLLHYIKNWASNYNNPNEFFDVEWYLTMYPEVADAGMEPAFHYLNYGAFEDKNPCLYFHTSWYLSEYKDVKNNGLNPLVHYLQYGQHEGRRTMSDLSIKVNIDDKNFVGILHTPHTKYLANLIKASLNKLSIYPSLLHDIPKEGFDDGIYFVICPQMFEKLPDKYIAYQMEQSINSRWFNLKYSFILQNALAVLDYSTDNISYLKSELKIQNNRLYYLPIDYSYEHSNYICDQDETYDVLFYGDPHCDRRRIILDQLSYNFNVKIITNLFDEDLYKEINKARIILNIHYYEGALLETTRIWECLSLHKIIISEESKDINEHKELHDLVDFVEINNVDAMIDRIYYWLSDENNRKDRVCYIKNALNNRVNKFEFFFYRFMLANENISFDRFWDICGNKLVLESQILTCLTLPEFPERKKDFESDCLVPFSFFHGMRHYRYGWIGCGLSYKLMMKIAKKQNMKYAIICEDDVEFLDDFIDKYNEIIKNIKDGSMEWDIVSGFMSDIAKDVNIKRTIELNDQQIIVINKMISMVFNFYNESVYDLFEKWNETNYDAINNTIDRYIEKEQNLKILLIFPYLVGHKEDLQSTIWGFNNTKYNELINDSINLMQKKIMLDKSI